MEFRREAFVINITIIRYINCILYFVLIIIIIMKYLIIIIMKVFKAHYLYRV